MGGTLSLEQQAHEDITSSTPKISHAQKLEAVHKFIQHVPVKSSVHIQTNQRTCTALLSLISVEYKAKNVENVIALLQVFIRLLFYKGFYKFLRRCNLEPLILTLESGDHTLLNHTLDVILGMIDCAIENVGSECCASDPEFEEENPIRCSMEAGLKETFLAAKGFEQLVATLAKHGPKAKSDDLSTQEQNIVSKTLQALHLSLVERSFTSSFKLVDTVTKLIFPKLKMLLDLTISPYAPIRKHAALLLQGLLLHSKGEMTEKIQNMALGSGKLLWYLYFSINKEGMSEHAQWQDADSMVAFRDLIGYLSDGNDPVTMVIHHALPRPMVDRAYANPLPLPIRMSSDYTYYMPKAEVPIFETSMWVRFARGTRRRSNWRLVFDMVDMVINTPTLIWNNVTKDELIETLQNEVSDFKVQCEIDTKSVWDHEGFEVVYESLVKHLKISKYFVHLLLPLLEACFVDNPHAQSLQHVVYLDPTCNRDPVLTPETFDIPAAELTGLVSACFQRAVVEDDIGWKLACLRVMSALYAKYSVVLQEADMMPYLIWLLTPKTSAGTPIDLMHTQRGDYTEPPSSPSARGRVLQDTPASPLPGASKGVFTDAEHHLFSTVNNPLWRDHILRFLAKLFDHTTNINRFVASDGVNSLLYYINDVHREQSSDVANLSLLTNPSERAVLSKADVSPVPSTSLAPLHLNVSASSTSPMKTTPNGTQAPISPVASRDAVLSLNAPRRVGKANRLYNKDDLLTGVAAPHNKFKVAHRCLRLLNKIVVNAPRLRKGLFKERVLVTLVQVLLVDHAELIDVALDTLITLIDSNTHVIPELASTGVFTFLLYAMRDQRPCTPNMATFITKYHLKQSLRYIPKGESILSPFLPSPLVKLACKPRKNICLRDVFNACMTTPLIYWDDSTKAVLSAALCGVVHPFLEQLRHNPYSIYTHATPAKVCYTALNRELFVADVYVRLFNENKDVELDDAEAFLIALVEEMGQGKYYGHMNLRVVDTVGDLPPAKAVPPPEVAHVEGHLVDLMRAQITMSQRFPSCPVLLTYEPLPRLLQVLASCAGPYIMSNTIYRVAIRLLKTIIVIPTSQNAFECVQRNAVKLVLQLIAHTAKAMEGPDDEEEASGNVDLLNQLFLILFTLIVRGHQEGDKDKHCAFINETIRTNATLCANFFPLLTNILALDAAKQRPHLATSVIRVIIAFYQHALAAQPYLLKHGLVLDAVNLALNYSALPADLTHTPSPHSPTGADAALFRKASFIPPHITLSMEDDNNVRAAAIEMLSVFYSCRTHISTALDTSLPPLVYCNTFHSHDLGHPTCTTVFNDAIEGVEASPLPVSQSATYFHNILVSMLSPGMCSLLSNPTLFISAADGDVATPYCIWNTAVRADVSAYLDKVMSLRAGTFDRHWLWGVTANARVVALQNKVSTSASTSSSSQSDVMMTPRRTLATARSSGCGPADAPAEMEPLKMPYLCLPMQKEVVVQGLYVRLFASSDDELSAPHTPKGFLEGVAWALQRIAWHAGDKAHMGEWVLRGAQEGILTLSTDAEAQNSYSIQVDGPTGPVFVDYTTAVRDAVCNFDRNEWSMRGSVAVLASAIAKLGRAAPVLITDALSTPTSGLIESLHLLASGQRHQEQAILHALEVFISEPQLAAYQARSRVPHSVLGPSMATDKKAPLGPELIVEYVAHDLHHILMRDNEGVTSSSTTTTTIDGVTTIQCGTTAHAPGLLLALDILTKLVVVQSVSEKAALLQRFWENGIILSLMRIVISSDSKSPVATLLRAAGCVDVVDLEAVYAKEYKSSQHYSIAHRIAAVKLLGLLVQHPIAGRYFVDACATLTTPNFEPLLLETHTKPIRFLTQLFSAVDHPGFFWSLPCVRDMEAFCDGELAKIREHHNQLIVAASIRAHTELRQAERKRQLATLVCQSRENLMSDSDIETASVNLENTFNSLISIEIDNHEYKRTIVGNARYTSYKQAPSTWNELFSKTVLSKQISVEQVYLYSLNRQLDYHIANEHAFMAGLIASARELMGTLLWCKTNVDEAVKLRALERNKRVACMLKAVRKPTAPETATADEDDSSMEDDSDYSDEEEGGVPTDDDVKALYGLARDTTHKLSAVLFTALYKAIANPALVAELAKADHFFALSQFCVLESDMEDINRMLAIEDRAHCSDDDNQGEGIHRAALARAKSLCGTGENTLIVQVLTLLQVASETGACTELVKQRVLRFVLPLSFVYFDFYMFQYGHEGSAEIPTPVTMRTVLQLIDNMLVANLKEVSTHLIFMGALVYLYNIIFQYDIAPMPILRTALTILVRLANSSADNMLSVLQFTHADMFDLLIVPVDAYDVDIPTEEAEEAHRYVPILAPEAVTLPMAGVYDCTRVLSTQRFVALIEAINQDAEGVRCKRVWDFDHRKALFDLIHEIIDQLAGAIAQWTPSAGRAFDVRALDEVWPPYESAVAAWVSAQIEEHQGAIEALYARKRAALEPSVEEEEQVEGVEGADNGENADGDADADASADGDADGEKVKGDVEAEEGNSAVAPTNTNTDTTTDTKAGADTDVDGAAAAVITVAPEDVKLTDNTTSHIPDTDVPATPTATSAAAPALIPAPPAPARAAPPPPPARSASPSASGKQISSRFSSLAAKFEQSATTPPPPPPTRLSSSSIPAKTD